MARRRLSFLSFLPVALLLTAALPGRCLAAAPPSEQPIPTARLLAPSDVDDVTLAPAGNRIAALTTGVQDHALVVFEWRGGTLTLILASRLNDHRSITSYRWLTDDALLINYVDFERNISLPAIASVTRRDIRFLDRFTTLVKAPWQDARHALLRAGSDCQSRLATSCLKVLDLVGGESQQISAPLTELPVQYLAVSPTEIYARGRERNGAQREYRLDPVTRAWRAVPGGTFASEQQALQTQAAPSAADLAAAARSGIQNGTLVFTEPGHHLVAVTGRPPQRAFASLDPRLDGLEGLLDRSYPGASVSISSLNDTLTRGLVTVWDADLPRHHIFFNDSGGFSDFAPFDARVAPAQLAHTQIHRDWLPNAAVAVTLPPEGTPLTGAVVQPLAVPAPAAEAPLHLYDGSVQALALHGIAVVRVLAPIPGEFASRQAGAAWRTMLASELSGVIARVSSGLLHGRDVCLYGPGLDGELSLAVGSLPHVGCVVAVNPLLDPHWGEKPLELSSPVNLGAGLWVTDEVTAAPEALLRRDIPAVFGSEQSNELADPVQWAGREPAHLLLVFSTRDPVLAQYAHDSGAFRAAAARAGKRVDYDAPDPGQRSEFENGVQRLDAVIQYLQRYFGGAGAIAAN